MTRSGMSKKAGTCHLTVSCPVATSESGQSAVSKSFEIAAGNGMDIVVITMPYASTPKE
ncbi:hypothetical protein [Bifidobacterium psychraerophilum]|uniref:hypothetical protein n=1 Tax=Bifidobacterium psychraerophilum TaxID=218140 RepID=UPI00138E3776|nr:hypothetical protein [Bifidobacterium psychraerophilum]